MDEKCFCHLNGFSVKDATARAQLEKKTHVFDCVGDMIGSKDLFPGMAVQTLGYYDPNDGGGGLYYIREKAETDVDNGGSIIFAGNYVAELNFDPGCVDVRQFGAKVSSWENSAPQIQKAIDACSSGGCVLFSMHAIESATLRIDKEITIYGASSLVGNDVSEDPHGELFVRATDLAIEVTDPGSLTLKGVTLSGQSGAGVGVSVTDANIKMDNAVIEGFTTGVKAVRGYYNKFTNSSIVHCGVCVEFDYCYNASLVNMRFATYTTEGSICVLLKNDSHVHLYGCSLECFCDSGIKQDGENTVQLYGCYFEGEYAAKCVEMGANGRVISIGSHVYLTAAYYFIKAEVDGVHILSKNNEFAIPDEEGAYSTAYYIRATDTSRSDIEISGDKWESHERPNNSYLAMAKTRGNNRIKITNPVGYHSNYKNEECDFNSEPFQMLPAYGNVPQTPGTMAHFANAGYGTDDPAGLHYTDYGYVAYTAIYTQGEWQKVGVRLPNQQNTSGATLEQLEQELNTLKNNMRANGIMI